MHHLSIKLSESLFEELKYKAIASNKTLSDLAREYLTNGLNSSQDEQRFVMHEENNGTLKHLSVFTLFTHCLLEQFIKSTVPNGSKICDLAELKAEKMALDLIKKNNNN